MLKNEKNKLIKSKEAIIYKKSTLAYEMKNKITIIKIVSENIFKIDIK